MSSISLERNWFWLMAAMLFAASSWSAPKTYELDPVHTRIEFDVDHLGFSRSGGRFGRFSGKIEFDREAPERSRLEVVVQVASLDMGDADWNRKMLGRQFFDQKRFAQMRFNSTRIQMLDATRGQMTGTLDLLGRSLPLVLEFRLNRHAVHKYTRRDTLGFSATGLLSRSAFGMDALIPEVGDEVQLRLEVEAWKQRRKRIQPPGR